MTKRKKQAPAAQVVNVTLTDLDIAAKSFELAKRVLALSGLRKQKAEQAADMQRLIDNELDLISDLCPQIIGGTELRNQATLKFGEGDEPAPAEGGTKPPEEETLPPAAETKGAAPEVPPAVAAAIAKSGGEVDLSAAKAKNGTKGKKQPPKASGFEPVIVAKAPTACPECQSKVNLLDASGLYGCADDDNLGCGFLALVEQIHVTQANA